jgi:hypothetical protein
MRTGEQPQRWAPGDVIIATVTGSGYRAFTVLAIITFAAKAARISTFSTSAKLYACKTLLERLAQDLEHMTAKLGQLIQEEDAVVGQRHFAWHRHVAPADQPDI